MAADAIVPDTKDWTWTTRRRCAECGFDASGVSADDLPSLVRGLTEPWRDVLAGHTVTVRPTPTTWSPLEYAGHVRDVLEVFAGRFTLILEEDAPTLQDWDQDAAAIEHHYAGADADRTAGEIVDQTTALLAVLDRYADPAAERGSSPTGGPGRGQGSVLWDRAAQRSDGAEFTALSLARYLTHDLAHHLYDVGAGDRIPRPGRSGAGRGPSGAGPGPSGAGPGPSGAGPGPSGA